MSGPKNCHIQHTTLNSRLVGTLDDSGTVSRYRGLPYASIDKRWTQCIPHPPLGPDFDALKFGPKCPQPEQDNNTLDFGPFIPFPDCGSDDLRCLNLNVICPHKIAEPLPVFVWIHGGSLVFGAGSDPMWEPTPLVMESIKQSQPVIVVTINYRLGPFGFLSPADGKESNKRKGNFGLHDQRHALKWVQQHIADFGGDPNRVTIGGESAGGCSVHAQLNLQEKLDEPNLFRSAVIQSGTAAVMGFWDGKRMEEIWHEACTEVGVTTIEEMQGLPSEVILGLESLSMTGYGVFCDDYFISEPLFSSQGDFLECEPKKVDAVMHGDLGDEGNIFRQAAAEDAVYSDLDRVAEEVLGAEGRNKLLELYGLECETHAKLTPAETAWRIHRIPEDARFYVPSMALVKTFPQAAFFHLTAKSPLSTSRWSKDSYHTLDLLYLFGAFDKILEAEGLADQMSLAHSIRSTWLRFINGSSPWRDAYKGVAATFDVTGTRYGPADKSRGWPDDRVQRVHTILDKVGLLPFVKLATELFP